MTEAYPSRRNENGPAELGARPFFEPDFDDAGRTAITNTTTAYEEQP